MLGMHKITSRWVPHYLSEEKSDITTLLLISTWKSTTEKWLYSYTP